MTPRDRILLDAFTEALTQTIEPLTQRLGKVEKTVYTFAGATVLLGFLFANGMIKVGG